MRLTGLLLLIATFTCGCNADPRCRRETSLLRAEILDLEDKLAIAQSRGFVTDDGFVEGEVIVSDPSFGIPGETTIYESDLAAPTGRRRLFGRRPFARQTASPLEVRHEIYTAPGIIMPATRTSGVQDFELLIEPPTQTMTGARNTLPQTLAAPTVHGGPIESISPSPSVESDARESITTELEDLPSPSDTQNRSQPRRRPGTAPAIDIALDDLDDLEIDLATTSKGQTENDPRERSTAVPAIERITVNRRASRGQDVDGQLGDEGLNLLIQPREADGTVVLQAGRLEVDLIDPAGVGSRRSVGHWEFLDSETELFFARDRVAGDGILLHLPWEHNLPQREKLLVKVRFVTPDGQAFDTSSLIEIDPPVRTYSADNPLVTGWTQRDTRWQIGTNNELKAEMSANESWQASSSRGRNASSNQRHITDSSSEGNEVYSPEKRRVRAIPASSVKLAPDRPRWRPVR